MMELVSDALDMSDKECLLLPFSGICEKIRENMNDMIETKHKKSEKDKMVELRIQGSFNFLALKQLNRVAQIRCKEVKEETLEAKQKLDGYNLTLDNLQYEINHLNKEITKCVEFKSRHDDVSLVPIAKFYEEAPIEISKPETTRNNNHSQTLARLDWELEQRKRLSGKLNALEDVKSDIAKRTSEKKDKLNSLVPCLDNLLKMSLPLQEALDLPMDKTRKLQELSALLPRPLFVLFIQSKAYQEACDLSMEVVIEGDEEAARKLQQIEDRSVTVQTAGSAVKDVESDSETEEVDEQDSGRKRRSNKKQDQEVKMDVQDSQTAYDKVFHSHPLHVKIIIKIKPDQGTTLDLSFSYFQNLGCVAVKAVLQGIHIDAKSNAKSLLQNSGLLDCLKPSDTGSEIPNKSCQYLLSETTTSLESIFNEVGRPYSWAQNLCGLDFFNANDHLKQKPGQDMNLSFKHIGNTIKLIRQRVNSRMTLVHEISSFGKCVVDCSHLKTETQSTLESWKCLTKEEFSSMKQNQTIAEFNLLVSDDTSFYLATLQHKWTKAKLEAAFVLFPDHPRSVPLVTLNLAWKSNRNALNDSNIREMEVHLNTGIVPFKNPDNILSTQMSRLMSMLDTYMDNEDDTMTDMQPTAIMQVSTQMKMKGQRTGPARLKPFFSHTAAKI